MRSLLYFVEPRSPVFTRVTPLLVCISYTLPPIPYTLSIALWYTFLMFNFWPYLLRLAVAFYFIYPHAQNLMLGAKKMSTAVFACINEYIPKTIAFTLWHAFFVILGILILIWPRPILPLLVALIFLGSELYINFAMHSYTVANMMLFILILVTIALIIYHSRPQFR